MALIEIRPITDAAGCTAVEQLQIDAWHIDDSLEVVPGHMLLTFHKNGGVLLVAYAGERLVGFVVGFVGLMGNGRFKHASLIDGHPSRFPGAGQWHPTQAGSAAGGAAAGAGPHHLDL